MEWLFLTMGATGALSLIWLVRLVHRIVHVPPEVQAHVGPSGSFTEAVIDELKQARREILVLSAGFSARPIAQALVEARLNRRVVDILVGADTENDTNSDLPFLLEQGLHPVIVTGSAPMPGTVILVDRRTVLAGTWRLSPGPAGDETLLIIKGHPEAARLMLDTYNAQKAHVRPAEIKSAQVPEPRPAPAARAIPSLEPRPSSLPAPVPPVVPLFPPPETMIAPASIVPEPQVLPDTVRSAPVEPLIPPPSTPLAQTPFPPVMQAPRTYPDQLPEEDFPPVGMPEMPDDLDEDTPQQAAINQIGAEIGFTGSGAPVPAGPTVLPEPDSDDLPQNEDEFIPMRTAQILARLRNQLSEPAAQAEQDAKVG